MPVVWKMLAEQHQVAGGERRHAVSNETHPFAGGDQRQLHRLVVVPVRALAFDAQATLGRNDVLDLAQIVAPAKDPEGVIRRDLDRFATGVSCAEPAPGIRRPGGQFRSRRLSVWNRGSPHIRYPQKWRFLDKIFFPDPGFGKKRTRIFVQFSPLLRIPCEPMPDSDDLHERFMRLFLAHQAEILRAVIVFVPHRHDAMDIVQETAIALWRHFDEFDSERPFVNWACGFARIEVKRFLRRAQRHAVLSVQAVAALEETAQGGAGEGNDYSRHLEECCEKLVPEHRQVLGGYYVDDESVEALAARHRRSVEAIYKLLQRIRYALLDCIERKSRKAQT